MEAVGGLLDAGTADLAGLVPIVVEDHQAAHAQERGAEREVDEDGPGGVAAIDVDEVELRSGGQHPWQLVGREALDDRQRGQAQAVDVAVKARLDGVVLLLGIVGLVEPRIDDGGVDPAGKQMVDEGQVAAFVGADLQVVDALLIPREVAQQGGGEGHVVVGPGLGEFEAGAAGVIGKLVDLAQVAGAGEHCEGERTGEAAVHRGEGAEGLDHGGVVSKNGAALDPHRPGGQRRAGAGSADAHAILQAKEGAVRGAGDYVALGREVAIAEGRQRQAGVRAAVAEAEGVLALAHHEGGEEPLAGAEDEALGAGVGDLGEGAEPGSRRRGGRVWAQGTAPTVARQGRSSMLAKRPALA